MSVAEHAGKLAVFIGSSSEGLEYARAVKAELERDPRIAPRVWEHAFVPSKSFLENLEEFVPDYDFAVFVLTPDDQLVKRESTKHAPRDNLIFELGMFISSIGRERVFYLLPKFEEAVDLPSDLRGIVHLVYTTDADRRSSVATACTEILRQIGLKGAHRPLKLRFWHSATERTRDAMDMSRMLDGCARRAFLSSVSMEYLVRNCRASLMRALTRGVRVEVALAGDPTFYRRIFTRYENGQTSTVDEVLAISYSRYEEFVASLKPEQAAFFAVYATDLPITHGVGLYDDALLCREMILNTDSADCPAFLLDKASPAWRVFAKEIRQILATGKPLFGSSDSQLLNDLDFEVS